MFTVDECARAADVLCQRTLEPGCIDRKEEPTMIEANHETGLIASQDCLLKLWAEYELYVARIDAGTMIPDDQFGTFEDQFGFSGEDAGRYMRGALRGEMKEFANAICRHLQRRFETSPEMFKAARSAAFLKDNNS